MMERISLNEVKEEIRTSATRHKVGIVVVALVVIGVRLFAPPEHKTLHLVDPVYTPATSVPSCWGNAFVRD